MGRVRIEGARVLITGAGSGIGAAAARRFARDGAHVIAVDLDADAAEATAADTGGTAEACDVADPDAVVALAERAGPVDVLVNNAGVGVASPFLDMAEEDWNWIRSINLDGVVHGCRAFAPGMAERGRGQIVNVASMAGYMAHEHMAAYCATKSAVIMFSQCLRADLAQQGVGVSVICPGVIKTPIHRHSRYRGSAAGRKDAVAKAFERFGHPPEAVADAMASAVGRDREIVPVGVESHVAFRVLRLAPSPVQSLLRRIAGP